MNKLLALPDEVLVQLYKRARIYLAATYLLLTFTVAYLCYDQLDGFLCGVLLFIPLHAGVWLSLKYRFNFNLFTLPLGLLILYYIDLYSNKEAPFYIFTLVMFVYVNVFVPHRIMRFLYLCLTLLVTFQMVYPDLFFGDILRIMVTYSVAAFTTFILVDYLKKVERDLAYKNQDLLDIFNCSPLPIMLLDEEGTIHMINDSCLDLIGFSQDELKGKTLREVYHFETGERVAELLRYFRNAIEDKKVIRIEEEYRKRNGEIISISADIKAIDLHGDQYILFVGQDVTKELKLRKEIQRTHKLYRTMAANIPNSAVYMFDRQLRFMLVEGDALTKKGSNKSRMVGKTLHEAFAPQTVTVLEHYFRAALFGVESSVEMDEDGKHLIYYFLPVRAENNEIMSGISLSVNITELKQTKTEVHEKDKMINDYAQKASHVVRRPIASLLGLTEILMNHKNSEEERRTIIKFIYDSVKDLDDKFKDAAVELNKK